MTSKDDTALVTPALLRKWQKEQDRIAQKIAELQQKQANLDTLIKAGGALASSHENSSVVPEKPRKAIKARRGSAGADTWKALIHKVVSASDRPLPYSEVKAELMKTSLAERLRRSEKGFYGAIGILAEKRLVVRHKGHLLAPHVAKAFFEDLKAGKVRDLKAPNPAHHSPMGDAIKAFMKNRPKGANSGNVIWEMRKTPAFKEAIERNKTYPYNVLKRLVEQGFLSKRNGRYYFVHLENEEPSEEGSSSITDGAPTPSIESQKVRDLLG